MTIQSSNSELWMEEREREGGGGEGEIEREKWGVSMDRRAIEPRLFHLHLMSFLLFFRK